MDVVLVMFVAVHNFVKGEIILLEILLYLRYATLRLFYSEEWLSLSIVCLLFRVKRVPKACTLPA